MSSTNQHTFNTLRILSQSENGYIGQCNCCDHFNFAFGNALFVFTKEGLRGFQEVLHDKSHTYQMSEALPNGKSIILPSPIPNFMLTYDAGELEQIKNLFQEAFLVLEIDKIFSP